MERINIALGHLPLDKIQPLHLMEFYKNLSEDGIRQNVKYTPLPNFKEDIEFQKPTSGYLVLISSLYRCTVER